MKELDVAKGLDELNNLVELSNQLEAIHLHECPIAVTGLLSVHFLHVLFGHSFDH